MLVITQRQMQMFDAAAGEHYLERLASVWRDSAFSGAASRSLERIPPGASLKDLARKLVQIGQSFDIVAEGDLSPFCILAWYDDLDFRNSSTYEWINAILTQKELPAEARIDALYCLLPQDIRSLIFDTAARV